MKLPGKSNIVGIIASRNCPSCGHHEIGITTVKGDFYPLRPGAWVQVLENAPMQDPSIYQQEKLPEISQDQMETALKKIPWVPDHARKFRSLALKYGVMLPADQKPVQMNSKIFERAYLQKLCSLIEKEKDKPLAVILDQFFSSPHLASGNPGEIASNMWNELEEIREPAERIRQLLESPEGKFNGLGPPERKEKPYKRAIEDSELSEELENMSLEEFLSLL
jgi:hypothetical protein